MSSVQVSDIVKRFGPVVALNLEGSSLTIEKGEIFAVIGPSGSGKTTFLRCIAGLEVPDKGEVVIGDTAVFSSTKGVNLPPEKRNIGYVPQTWGLWPHMKVWDNIAFGLKIRRVAPDMIRIRVRRTAEALRIEHLLDRYPWQLSGGQQQRVALARAIVLEPSLLLLDEPISNLDAALRDEARIWLRATIKAMGITSIYVTHDIREALTLGDRVALIADGRFRRIGPPQELYKKVDDPILASLLRFNILRGKAVKVEGGHVEVEVGGSRISCESGQSLSEGSEVLVYFSPKDIVLGRGELVINIMGSSYSGDRYEVLAEIGNQSIRLYSEESPPAGKAQAGIERCLASPHTI